MVEIFFHFFTNNHMHRAFSFFRLISWKVSVSLFHCRLAEEWLPSAKLSFHLVGRYFFSARFSASFCEIHPQARVPIANVSNVECGGEFRKCQEGHRRPWEMEKGKFCAKITRKVPVLFSRKASRWRLNSMANVKTTFRWCAFTAEVRFSHQHSVDPNECGLRFLSRRRFLRKAETVGCYQRVNSVIGWQCGLRQ